MFDRMKKKKQTEPTDPDQIGTPSFKPCEGSDGRRGTHGARWRRWLSLRWLNGGDYVEPHKRVFREWRAIRLFMAGTLTLCVGLVISKEGGKISVKFLLLCLGVSLFFFAMSFVSWRLSRPRRRRHRRFREASPARRNPPAKLPPLREL